ncbi:zinc finger protein 62 homolog [Diorhabda sublineata]|uniref:zinc finger protein 62 homolog n=1 Tax=Diorhabda sublineata TaxID=1163346 RepID=UPI0024E0A8BC|nr:zinc finger protein 62 homolog [Diorhabda sublineata]
MERIDSKRKICRLCLSETIVYYSLLDEDKAIYLEALTSIKIDEDEPFSTNACVQCCLSLKYAFQIQQNILEVDRKLRTVDELELEEESAETAQEEIKSVEDNTEEEPKHTLDHDYEGHSINIFVDDEENYVEYEQVKIEPYSEENSLDEVTVQSASDELTTEQNFVIPELNRVGYNKVPCKICGLEVVEKELLQHTQFHYFSTVKCDECNLSCDNIHSYRKHLAEEHKDYPSNKSWSCKNCNTSFLYKPLYIIHFKSAHPPKAPEEQEPGTYQCFYCKKKFYSERRRDTHAATHKKKQCDICSVYITPSNFPAHRRSHFEDEVECPICSRKYKNTISLKGHIHYTHSTRSYLCEFCDKSFKKSYALLLHIKREHTGERSHVCDLCGKSFLTFYNLSKHKKMTHQKLRPFKCNYCHKKFSSKFAVRTHERQHTLDAPFQCDICGQSFRQKVSLKGHRKSIHNIEEPLTCACEVCGKKFSNKFAVMSHMRLH